MISGKKADYHYPTNLISVKMPWEFNSTPMRLGSFRLNSKLSFSMLGGQANSFADALFKQGVYSSDLLAFTM